MPNPKQKRVLFHDSTLASYDDELCMEEKKALWYQPQEIESFSSDLMDIVKALRRGAGETYTPKNEKRCLRGLEKYFLSNNTLVSRKEVKRTFIKTILEIQREHRMEISNDPRGLRVLASACSRNAHNFARKLAAQDEADAFQISFPKHKLMGEHIPTVAKSA